MFKKAFGFSAEQVEQDGEFVGYASTVHGEPDAYGDIVLPGAFEKTLARHAAERSMPVMLFGHKADELPIGDWVDMAEDDKGLRVRGRLDLDDPESARVHRALKKGRVNGLSIGYAIPAGGIEPDPDREGVYFLKEIDLREVSIVNWPANRSAMVDNVKAEAIHKIKNKLAAGDRLTVREFESFVQISADLSNSQAERAARVHLKGQGEPAEAADDGLAFLLALKG